MATMTRRHFQLIADELSHAHHEGMFKSEATFERFSNEFASTLSGTNPLFQRERFLKAARR